MSLGPGCFKEMGKVSFPHCSGVFTSSFAISLQFLQTQAQATTCLRAGQEASLASILCSTSLRSSGGKLAQQLCCGTSRLSWLSSTTKLRDRDLWWKENLTSKLLRLEMLPIPSFISWMMLLRGITSAQDSRCCKVGDTEYGTGRFREGHGHGVHAGNLGFSAGVSIWGARDQTGMVLGCDDCEDSELGKLQAVAMAMGKVKKLAGYGDGLLLFYELCRSTPWDFCRRQQRIRPRAHNLCCPSSPNKQNMLCSIVHLILCIQFDSKIDDASISGELINQLDRKSVV